MASDDIPRLSEVEAERVLALSVLAAVLLIPALIEALPDGTPPVPSATCPEGAYRSSGDRRIYCGTPPPGMLPAPALTASELVLAGTPIDLDHATAADLQLVPGIGPKLAARIIAARETHGPFRTAEDLTRVPGVGPKLLRELSRYTRITATPAPR